MGAGCPTLRATRMSLFWDRPNSSDVKGTYKYLVKPLKASPKSSKSALDFLPPRHTQRSLPSTSPCPESAHPPRGRAGPKVKATVSYWANRGATALDFWDVQSPCSAETHPTHAVQPYLTFSCQGSFRATADGSSGSLLKEVGVCASCSESRRLQDAAVKQRNRLLREKVPSPRAPRASLMAVLG